MRKLSQRTAYCVVFAIVVGFLYNVSAYHGGFPMSSVAFVSIEINLYQGIMLAKSHR